MTCDLSDPEAEPVNLEVDGEQYVYARKLLMSREIIKYIFHDS